MEADPAVSHALPVESGSYGNPAAVSALVFAHVVDVPEARWIRLLFDDVNLEGKSYIRVESHLTGEWQVLDRESIGDWRNSTAPLPGGRVTIELHAGPGTVNNYFSIGRVLAGSRMEPERGATTDAEQTKRTDPVQAICAPRDLRLPFTRNAIGRLRVPGEPCTATIALCPGSCGKYAVLLTAGHCFTNTCTASPQTYNFLDPPPFIEFNVQGSDKKTCAMGASGQDKKFPLTQVITRGSCNIGEDWAVFLVGRNSNTKKTVLEEQRDYMFIQTAGAAQRLATIGGYGRDGGMDSTAPASVDHHCQPCKPENTNAEFNFTLQRHHAYITAVDGNKVYHQIQTCSSNSGSALYVNGNAGQEIIAIHTHGITGQCASGITRNAATNLRHPLLLAAIAEMCQKAKAKVQTLPGAGNAWQAVRSPQADCQ